MAGSTAGNNSRGSGLHSPHHTTQTLLNSLMSCVPPHFLSLQASLFLSHSTCKKDEIHIDTFIDYIAISLSLYIYIYVYVFICLFFSVYTCSFFKLILDLGVLLGVLLAPQSDTCIQYQPTQIKNKNPQKPKKHDFCSLIVVQFMNFMISALLSSQCFQ
ncbi:unnamed protein product [Camellia sinensis]